MAKTIHSGNLTFIDLTDSKKVDVHISSNLPTIQIYDANNTPATCSPDWTSNPLKLTLTAYADSTDITNSLTNDDIVWYRQIGSGNYVEVQKGGVELQISNNELIDEAIGWSAGIISYICQITYNSKTFENKVTFARTDTGRNGSNGTSAPAVQAQYSVDGTSGWTTILDTATHKYVHYSYDGGVNWTAAIKMAGEDGTSVVIKGTAYTPDALVAGQIVRLYLDSNHNTVINTNVLSTGDSYLVNGYLCVYNEDNNCFVCTGTIQGPKGNDGVSEYVYIKYAPKANPSNSEMLSTPNSATTHIGICVSALTNAPSTASSYTWSKFVGDNAKSIVLSGDSQVFKVGATTPVTYTPSTIRLTANRINIPATTTLTWSYNYNDDKGWTTVKPSNVTISGDTATIAGASLASNSLTIKVSDGSVEDVFTVYKAFDGVKGDPASMAFLTNENVSFSANANGIVTALPITTNVVAYNGTTKQMPAIGEILDAPEGMIITTREDTLLNEVELTVSFDTDAELGSKTSISGIITIPVTSPVVTNLKLSWSKINSGAKGDKGDKGVDSYTVLLTNESHIFAGDVNNAVEGTAETQILAYKGSTPQTVRIDSVDGVPAGIIDTNTTIPGLKFVCDKLSSDDNGSPKITFKCTTAFKKANGTIPIKLTVDGIQFEKIFTYSIAFKGGIGVQGPQGTAGKSMSGVIEHYLVSASATGVTTSTSGWTETMQTVTSDKKYLWNYETITYSDGTINTINPVIIGVYGDTGPSGKGVSSIVEEYYQSTSATAQSDGTWSTTPPAWANGKYIWTRSIIKYTDNTTSTTSPVCITGQQGAIGGTGIGVDSVDVWYYQSTSATALSGGSWSTKSPTWADGKYIWTKTITTYTNSTTDETAAVCITGQKGATGVGIKSVTEYYLATSSASDVTTSTSGWTTSVQTTTSVKKYLWNYEVITYTDNSSNTLNPIIIGVYGDTGSTGKGISGVKEYYLATTLASGVTTATSGWTPEMQAVTSTKKYLWNYEIITYTDNTTSTVAPILIGAYGDTGAPATSYWLVSSASAVQKTSTGTIAVTPSTLTFTGKSKTGTSAPVDYACRWIIAYSTDGTNYTNLYTSTANEASKAITVATTYKTIRARMYMAGGTTALLDEQIIPIVSDGAKGDTGRGISKITENYLATTASSGVTTTTSGWTEAIQTVDSSKRYLWNYEVITYTDNTTSSTTPVIIGVFGNTGNTGKGIKSVTEYYLATTASSGVTTSTTGWKDTMQSLSATNKYLWNYELITYTDNTTATIAPVIIGVYGDKGAQGDRGAGISSVTVTYGTSTSASTQPTSWQTTLPTVAEGSYLWTRTVTDYTDASIADTVTLTYAKQGAKGSTGSAGTSVTVSSIQYQAGTSATTAPTSTWSNSVVTVAEGSYLWTKTTFSDGKVAYGVAKQGAKGSQGIPAVTFQIYAPNGYLLTIDNPSLTLQTIAYEGSVAITSGTTFKWYGLTDGVWTLINGATSNSLSVSKADVLKSKSYKCEMTYKNNTYISTATVEDKTDIYNSLIHATSKYSSTNRLYWVLYSIVYSEEGERDELLGPINTIAPSNPATGDYWYKVDETNYTVDLMKYSGTAWAATDDKQELVYDWFLLNDVDNMITLGAQSKVKIVTANDFSRTCSVQCNVSDSELILLAQNNQILTDPSDPIISATEPANPINGQLWIKTNANGSYTLLVWDSSVGQWVVSEADTQNKVYVTKPTQYNTGDIWIVDSNYLPTAYENGVMKDYKHPEKTMLRATASSQIYNDAHWVEALKYQKELDDIVEDVGKFKKFISIDDTGLIMQAKDVNGAVSDFKTVLTNTELGFYQGASRVAYINNNQLNISKAEITNGMKISGTTPELQIGNFVLIQESNGSLSIGLKS